MPLCFRSLYVMFSACRSAARGRSHSPLFVSYFHSHNLTFEQSSHSQMMTPLCNSLCSFMQVLSVLVLMISIYVNP